PIRPPPLSPLLPYTTLFRSPRRARATRLRPSRGLGSLIDQRPPDPGCDDRRAGDSDLRRDRFRRDVRLGVAALRPPEAPHPVPGDRKSTRLNSSHLGISYAV